MKKVKIEALVSVKNEWELDDDITANEAIQSCLDEINESCAQLGVTPTTYKVQVVPVD